MRGVDPVQQLDCCLWFCSALVFIESGAAFWLIEGGAVLVLIEAETAFWF
jgi:hypothetical protein